MPLCCSCMSNGRCLRCACVKEGRACTDCRPSRMTPHRCENQLPTGEHTQESSTPGTPTSTSQSTFILPTFTKSQQAEAEVTWGILSGRQQISNIISKAYNQIVQWKPNVFMIPSGSQGKLFVKELTRLFNAFNTESALESVAIKAAMIMPALLLQKPQTKSKTKSHIISLKRRLELWEKGDISSLLKEGELIQRQLPSAKPDIEMTKNFHIHSRS